MQFELPNENNNNNSNTIPSGPIYLKLCFTKLPEYLGLSELQKKYVYYWIVPSVGFLFLFFVGPHHVAYGILVLWPETEPRTHGSENAES